MLLREILVNHLKRLSVLLAHEVDFLFLVLLKEVAKLPHDEFNNFRLLQPNLKRVFGILQIEVAIISIVTLVTSSTGHVLFSELSVALTSQSLELLAIIITFHVLSESTWHFSVSRQHLDSVLSVESTVNLLPGTVRELLVIIIIHADVFELIELRSGLIILFHVLHKVLTIIFRLNLVFVVNIIKIGISHFIIVVSTNKFVISVVFANKVRIMMNLLEEEISISIFATSNLVEASLNKTQIALDLINNFEEFEYLLVGSLEVLDLLMNITFFALMLFKGSLKLVSFRL